MSPRRLFRIVAIAEAVTWVLLIAGMIIRAVGVGALGVSIGGGLHGFVFLAFVLVLVFVAANQRWKPQVVIIGLLCSIIPLATVPFDLVAERRGLLDGAWRTESDSWGGRLRRVAVRHPVLSGSGVVAAVAAAFLLLLWIGPPGA